MEPARRIVVVRHDLDRRLPDGTAKAGLALGICAIGSFVGGTLSVVGLTVGAPILASYALRFGPAEYFSLVLVGLLMVVYLSGESILKGAIMASVGLIAGPAGEQHQRCASPQSLQEPSSIVFQRESGQAHGL